MSRVTNLINLIKSNEKLKVERQGEGGTLALDNC